MPKLFVANLSKQHHLFLYQLLGSSGTIPQEIPIGAQVEIHGSRGMELDMDQINAIVEHHSRYGLKSVAEARKVQGFTGLVYGVDKPVNLDERGFVEEVVHSSDETLNERNADRRSNTTAAIAKRLGDVGAGSKAPLLRTEVEQSEETEGTPRVDVGVEAVSQGVRPRNASARRAN